MFGSDDNIGYMSHIRWIMCVHVWTPCTNRFSHKLLEKSKLPESRSEHGLNLKKKKTENKMKNQTNPKLISGLMRSCNGIDVWKHLPQVVSIQNDFQEILALSCATKCVIRMLSVFLTQSRGEDKEHCKAMWASMEMEKELLVWVDVFLLGEDSLQHTRSEPTNISYFCVDSSVSVVGQQPDEGFLRRVMMVIKSEKICKHW